MKALEFLGRILIAVTALCLANGANAAEQAGTGLFQYASPGNVITIRVALHAPYVDSLSEKAMTLEALGRLPKDSLRKVLKSAFARLAGMRHTVATRLQQVRMSMGVNAEEFFRGRLFQREELVL